MAETVKICGITNVAEAAAAFAAGADLVGLVFWQPSRRYVSIAQAQTVVRKVAGSYVAVFKDATWSEVEAVLAAVDVVAVQMHGTVPPRWIEGIHRAHKQAISTNVAEVGADICLQDGPLPGSGQPWQWALPNLDRKFWLAGGLHAGNVRELVRRWQPDGVDVSTGVERDGHKEASLMQEFVKEARKGWQH